MLKRKGYQIETVNIHQNPEKAKKYNVSWVPTFIFFSEGVEARRATGNLSVDRIEYMFRSASSFF